MNIHGYYEADDIWVPDPHEKEFTYHKVINEYQPKPEKVDDVNTSFMSDIEQKSAFKASISMQQFQPINISNERRGFGNTLTNITTYRETENFGYDPVMNQTQNHDLHKDPKLILSDNVNKNNSLFQNNQDMSILSEQPSQMLQRQQTRTKSQDMDKHLYIFQNNGGVEDMVKSHNYQEVINVSKKTKDDKIEFDITVSLYSAPKDRFMFQITQKMNFQLFFAQIKDAFELKYDYFKGLKGLRVKNMRVKQPNLLLGLGLVNKEQELLVSSKPGVNESMASMTVQNPKQSTGSNANTNAKQHQNDQSLNIDQMRKIEVENQDELVSNVLRPRKGDYLYIEMESQELWLQVKMKMKNSDVCFISDFDIKSDCNMNGRDLKKVIQKLAISIWNDLIKLEESNKNQNLNNSHEENDEIMPTFIDQQEIAKDSIQNAIQYHILANIEIFKLEVPDHRDHLSIKAMKEKRMKEGMQTKDTWIGNSRKVKENMKQTAQQQLAIKKQTFIPIDDDTLVMNIFNYQKNRLYVTCDFLSIIKYYQYFIEEMNRQISLQCRSIPTQIDQKMDTFGDEQKRQALEEDFEFLVNLENIDPVNLHNMTAESDNNLKQLKKMFRHLVDQEYEKNKHRMKHLYSTRGLSMHAKQNDVTMRHSTLADNQSKLNLQPNNLTYQNTQTSVKGDAYKNQISQNQNTQGQQSSSNDKQSSLQVRLQSTDNSNHLMTDVPNQDELNQDIQIKENREGQQDGQQNRAGEDSKRNESDSTIVQHKPGTSDIDDSNYINRSQDIDENALFSEQKQKQDNLRKRFLYTNQVQGQVMLSSQKQTVGGNVLLGKHRLIIQTINYIKDKRSNYEKMSQINNGAIHLNTSQDKIHINEIMNQIDFDDIGNNNQISPFVITNNQLSTVRRPAKSMMGQRLGSKQLSVPYMIPSFQQSEDRRDMSEIDERPYESEISNMDMNQSANQEQQTVSIESSIKVARKSEPQHTIINATQGSNQPLPYSKQTSNTSSRQNDAKKRGKSNTVFLNDYRTESVESIDRKETVMQMQPMLQHQETKMEMGTGSNVKQFETQQTTKTIEEMSMHRYSRVDSKISEMDSKLQSQLTSTMRKDSGTSSYMMQRSNAGGVRLFSKVETESQMESEICIMENVAADDQANVFNRDLSEIKEEEIRTVNFDSKYNPKSNPSVQQNDSSQSENGVISKSDDEVPQVTTQSYNFDSNNQFLLKSNETSSINVNSDFKHSAAMPLLKDNQMTRRSSNGQQFGQLENVQSHQQKSGRLSRFVKIFKKKPLNIQTHEDDVTAHFGSKNSRQVAGGTSASSSSMVFQRNQHKQGTKSNNLFTEDDNVSSKQNSQFFGSSKKDAPSMKSTNLSQFKNRFFNKDQRYAQDGGLTISQLEERTQNADQLTMSMHSREGLEYSDIKTFTSTANYKKDLNAFEARLMELLPLPSFLLTLEEYNQIPEPQLKNFHHREVSKIKGVNNMGLIKYKSGSGRIYNKKFSEYCCSGQGFMIWIAILLILGAVIYLTTQYLLVNI